MPWQPKHNPAQHVHALPGRMDSTVNRRPDTLENPHSAAQAQHRVLVGQCHASGQILSKSPAETPTLQRKHDRRVCLAKRICHQGPVRRNLHRRTKQAMGLDFGERSNVKARAPPLCVRAACGHRE